jgi:hypothetical protein
VAWLPADFTHPTWVPVGDGYHLRPIKAADADLDYPAVMGSQRRLWSIFGPAWGWPPASMTYQQDVEDLARHEAEIAGHQSFNYTLFDDAETALLGCVYIDPPEKKVSSHLQDVKGFCGARLLRCSDGQEVMFTSVAFFISIDAVRSFAGEDYEQAIVEEAARRALNRWDERVSHHDVSVDLPGAS